MRINLGVRAYLADGRQGPVIDRVIVDPRLWEVTHIVVEKNGGISEPKLVPLSEVQSWTKDRVELRLTPQQLAQMPAYVEQQYCAPCVLLAPAEEPGKGKVPSKEVFTQEGFPYGGGILPHETKAGPAPEPIPTGPEAGPAQVGPIELRNGALVEAVDGPIGRLDQMLLDTYINRITSIVVNGTGTKGREITVPVEWVAYLEPARIRLAATKQQLKDLIGPPSGNYLAQ